MSFDTSETNGNGLKFILWKYLVFNQGLRINAFYPWFKRVFVYAFAFERQFTCSRQAHATTPFSCFHLSKTSTRLALIFLNYLYQDKHTCCRQFEFFKSIIFLKSKVKKSLSKTDKDNSLLKTIFNSFMWLPFSN